MLKQTLKRLAALLLLLLALCLAGALYLRTPRGAAWLEATLSDLLSSRTGYTIALQGLHLSMGPTLQLDSLTLADPIGIWCEASGLRLHVDPLSLFRGPVKIPQLRVADLHLARRPAAPNRTPRPPRETAPRPVLLGVVRADQITLDPPVAGRALSLYAATGSLRVQDRTLYLQAAGDARLDERTLRDVHVSGQQQAGDGRWQVDVTTPRMDIGERELPSMRVEITASITNRTVQVDACARADAKPVLDASLIVSGPHVALTGSLHPLPDWPLEAELHLQSERGPDTVEITIPKLRAVYNGLEVNVPEPATLQSREGAWSIRAPRLLVNDTIPLDFEGRLRGEEWTAKLHSKSLPLAALPRLPGWLTEGQSHATVTLHGSGTLSDPTLALEVQPIDVPLADERLAPLGPLRLAGQARFEDRHLHVSVSVESARAGFVATELIFPADGSLRPWRAGIDMEALARADLRTEIRLDALNELPLGGHHLVRGTVYLNLAYDANEAEIQTTGRCEVLGGAYEHLLWGTRVRNFNGHFRPEGRTLLLDGASAWDRREGTLRSSVVLDFTRPLHPLLVATVDVRDFGVVESDAVTATGSGNLLLQTDVNSTTINGSFRVQTAEIRINRLPPTRPPSLEVIETGLPDTASTTEPRPRSMPMHDVTLAIDVRVPSGMMVRGPNFDSTWTGVLSLESRQDATRLLGEVNLGRGSMNFLGRRFILREGKLLFRGNVASPPFLDVRAEHERRELTAHLHLGGPINRPRFTLTSVPAFPSDEILARVLFGRGRDTITPAQAAQLALAVRSLSEDQILDGWRLTGRLRDAVGIDRIELAQEGERGDDAQLVLGRHTQRGTYLEYTESLGRGGESRIRIEKDLGRRFSIETQAGARTPTGIGLNWRFDY